MPKNKPKTKATKQAKIKQYVSKNRYNILISSLLILIALGFLLQPFYRDWENARFIRGLARDFPVLVSEIETATGLELEEEVNCSITTEKFTGGVRTCEFIVTFKSLDVELIKNTQNTINSSPFVKSAQYENGKGDNYNYMNQEACGLGIYARGGEIVSFSCITAVREANVDLARELFLNE